jgi:hypothetical protein
MNDTQVRAHARGRCPNCQADRNAEILAEDTQEGEDQASGIWGKNSFSILRCLGCDHRYIRHVRACSEDADPEQVKSKSRSPTGRATSNDDARIGCGEWNSTLTKPNSPRC